jgi:putative endonuclease
MAEHNELGKKGEAEAAQFLALKGYDILEKNWRYGKLEIDIIAQHRNKLVIIEVKARGTGIWGNPEEAVTKGKIKFLAEATEAYLNQNNIDLEVRFDIVSVLFQNDTFQIDHIEEAFHPQVNS